MVDAVNEEGTLGCGHRRKQVSVRLRDYVMHTIGKSSPSPSTLAPRHPSCTPYCLSHFVNCDKFSM